MIRNREKFKSHVTDTRRHKSQGSTNLPNLCSKLECRQQNYAPPIKIQIWDKAKPLSKWLDDSNTMQTCLGQGRTFIQGTAYSSTCPLPSYWQVLIWFWNFWNQVRSQKGNLIIKTPGVIYQRSPVWVFTPHFIDYEGGVEEEGGTQNGDSSFM